MDTLRRYAAQQKKLPPPLIARPKLDFHHAEFLRHFSSLSRGRSYCLVTVPGKENSVKLLRYPNPIDIATILRYNMDIVQDGDPEFFLEVIQDLDEMFLSHYKAE